LKIWLRLSGPFLTATIIPIVLGAVIGWVEIIPSTGWYFALNPDRRDFYPYRRESVNDYFDHLSRNDWNNQTPTPFSGGSRMIQEGIIKPNLILIVALTSFALGSLIGLYFNHIYPAM